MALPSRAHRGCVSKYDERVMLVTWGALDIYDGYIGIWLMAVAGELERQSSAVGRPYDSRILRRVPDLPNRR